MGWRDALLGFEREGKEGRKAGWAWQRIGPWFEFVHFVPSGAKIRGFAYFSISSEGILTLELQINPLSLFSRK
jgi:hypothetical protein